MKFPSPSYPAWHVLSGIQKQYYVASWWDTDVGAGWRKGRGFHGILLLYKKEGRRSLQVFWTTGIFFSSESIFFFVHMIYLFSFLLLWFLHRHIPVYITQREKCSAPGWRRRTFRRWRILRCIWSATPVVGLGLDFAYEVHLIRMSVCVCVHENTKCMLEANFYSILLMCFLIWKYHFIIEKYK